MHLLRFTLRLVVLSFLQSSFSFSAQTAGLSKPLTLHNVWSLDATFSDRNNGISFRYPSVWKSTMQFGYHPPALTLASGTYPNQIDMQVRGFGYSTGDFPHRAGGPYAATNLEGFGVVYSVLAASGARECNQKAAYVVRNVYNTKLSSVTISGRSYVVYRTNGAGMNQAYAGMFYATYNQGTCYLMETGVATFVPGALPNAETASVHDIDLHLWQLMKTVRIFAKK